MILFNEYLIFKKIKIFLNIRLFWLYNIEYGVQKNKIKY
jgi:hypothetical protein